MKQIFTAILILFGFSLILTAHEEKQYTFNAARAPQEYMKTIRVVTYREDGALKSKISAVRWAYLPETESSTMTMPYLILYKPDQSEWHIHSKQGYITQPTIAAVDEIVLEENVILHRPKTKVLVPITVETERLRFEPKHDFADSNAAIKLRKPGLVIVGNGMRAYLNESKVELLENVKTELSDDI